MPTFTFIKFARLLPFLISTALLAGHERPIAPPDETPGVRLVKDLHPEAEVRSFQRASALVPLGGTAYFLGGAGDWSQAEFGLWATDGTAAGTRLVRSLFVPDDTGRASGLVSAGDRLFFFAGNGGPDLHVWTSDGTAVGTRPLVPCGRVLFEVPVLVPAGGRVLFFLTPESGTDMELWASDGTPEGTRRLSAFIAHDTIYDIGLLTAWGDRVAFRGWDREHGQELWVSDGTTEGTRLFKDLVPGPAGSSPSDFLVWRGRLGFTALEGESGPWRMWASDGTEAGTAPIQDTPILVWGAGSMPQYASGGYLYFWAHTQDHPPGLWRTDGEPDGSVYLKELELGGTLAGFWAELSPGTIVFNGYDPEHGFELWRSDGTPTGTHPVSDLLVGPGSSWPYGLTAFNGTVYFAATQNPIGRELWRSDGTKEGTMLVRDLNAGALDSSPDGFQVWNGRLWFMADDGEHGIEFWTSTGTAEGTRPLVRLAPDAGSSTVSSLIPWGAGGVLLVTEERAGTPCQFWSSDGTPNGTQPFFTLDPAVNWRPPGELASRGDLALFPLFSTALGNEMWRTDGTAAGTRLVRDIVPGPADAVDNAFRKGAFLGADYYFPGSDGVHGLEPWATDGTVSGTRMAADICTDPEGYNPTLSSWPGAFIASSDRVFFTARGDDGNAGWYAGNGAVGGAILLASFDAPSDQIYLRSPAVVGNTAYLFHQKQWTAQWELWRSDGTTAGTGDIATLYDSWDRPWTPGPLFAFDGRVFFQAAPWDGAELWVSDGAPGGTGLLMDINPGDGDSSPADFAALGDRFYFRADDGVHGAELWMSDGTEAGTFMLVDLCPGLCSGYPMGMVADGDRIIFSATDGIHGHELWTTDGTVQGTTMVADIQAGPASSAPERITPSGPTVYFTADGGRTGRELWAFERR